MSGDGVKEGACCVGLAQMQTWRDGHEDRHVDIDSSLKAIAEDINAIKESMLYRLPIWATVLIGTLTAAIGWLAHR